MKNLHILIVGAGIGGMTAALALQRAGFRVSVFEQAPEISEVGAGLSISPNAALALFHVGLRHELETRSYAPERQATKHYRTGRLLADLARGETLAKRYGAKYYVIHRADLHAVLVSTVRANDPACIHVSHRCVGFTQDENGVVAKFDNGAQVRGDVLVACDGGRSALREQLFGPTPATFTGYIAWRGLVPMERVPKDFLDPPSGIYIGPQHLINRYPVRNWTQLNYVAFAERNGWEQEGWSIRAEVSEVMEEFRDWHPAVRGVIAATEPHMCHKWALLDRDPLPHWSKGRVTLLGDAAHPMLPFLGQGAAMAIEDGVIFARAFQAAGSVGEALERYETARKERTAFVMMQSRAVVKRFHSADPDSYTEADNMGPDERLGIFDYNPGAVPV